MITGDQHRIQLQRQVLPSEIIDAIIDHLQGNTAALGVCSVVCSEWLVRSRHHMFYRVQLWPWRARRFFELANERLCTFTNHVRRIEMDDSRASGQGGEVRKLGAEAVDRSLIFETMVLPHPPCFASVQSIQICNVDWTFFSMSEQSTFRNSLSRFIRLDQLELQGVVFHDLREVVRIVNVLTALQHLTANISFKKYLKHTIQSDRTLRLASNLWSLEIGTEDGIAAMLGCIGASNHAEKIRVLKLHDIKACHLPYIKTLLKKSGRNLQRVVLGFAGDKIPMMNQAEVADTIDLSRLQELHTLHIGGLTVPRTRSPSILEESLADVLQRIDSSFLDVIELSFVLCHDSDLRCMDWRQLERVLLILHLFSMRQVRVFFDIAVGVDQSWVWETVEKIICEAMPDLYRRGVLRVHSTKQRESDQAEIQGKYLVPRRICFANFNVPDQGFAEKNNEFDKIVLPLPNPYPFYYGPPQWG